MLSYTWPAGGTVGSLIENRNIKKKDIEKLLHWVAFTTIKAGKLSVGYKMKRN